MLVTVFVSVVTGEAVFVVDVVAPDNVVPAGVVGVFEMLADKSHDVGLMLR